MHGGLPFIGVSVLVYGLVGAVVMAREAVRWCRRAEAVPPVAAGRVSGAEAAGGVRGAAVTGQGVTAWPAASR